MKLVFATGNAHKARELGLLLAPLGIELVSFREHTGAPFELEETGATFEANAQLKAEHAAHVTGLPSIGDDSGLEVEALGGAPGLYSARYAGPGSKDTDNNARLVRELTDLGAPEPYSARFVCVLACVWPVDAAGARAPIVVRGECQGHVLTEAHGGSGFGYDPLFVPAGQHRRMAELSDSEKNAISHRGMAVKAFAAAWATP